MHEDLTVIVYPDPRLKRMSVNVENFDEGLKALANRMLDLMREHRGVGLAAPQVGHNIRMFVMNHSGDPKDDRVYVNPALSDPAGEEEAEEGCLSLPGVNANILRDKSIRLDAQDLDGRPVSATETGYIARIWQHEFDHLNGTLITDRMGPVAKMAWRRTLRDLEDAYEARQPKRKKGS